MKYVLFALAALCIVALAVFDTHARGDTASGAEVADAGSVLPSLPAPPEIDPATTAGQGFSDFKAGKYFAGVGSVLLLLVWALRKWGGQWFKSDRGGAIMALLAGQGLAFGTLSVVGLHIDGAVIFNTITAGLVLAVAGAGTRHVAINLATPPDKAAARGPEFDL